MKERKFAYPSQAYDKEWVIEQLMEKQCVGMKLVRKGENIFDLLDIKAHLSLPKDCLLVWGGLGQGYNPHGWMRDAYECEVALYYFE